MNIKTIQRHKNSLEIRIAKLLTKFEEETCCKVSHVFFDKAERIKIPDQEGEKPSIITENKVSLDISIV